MPTATYEQFVVLDPTESFAFKVGALLNRLLAKVRLRLLIEAARLFFLGFYDEFIQFVGMIEEAEARSRSEAEWDKIWRLRLHVAERIEGLLDRFALLERASYRGRDLLDYLIGRDRLEQLRLFVSATRLDQQAELAIQQSKREFLATFVKQKLSRAQRTAFLEKYREMTGAGDQR